MFETVLMSTPIPNEKADPKEDILQAAEQILATSGIEAATVRSITALAGVNTAAINYHFGSREGLFTVICSPHAAGQSGHH